ncbi:DUF1064 domain-containing protein [Marinococcus luteus]|uniref:DUF1064 domain-containing protein n=1 Tax=Marinococcus luteus TaxID=1122204 RepID=UPI002ACCE44F|nr:DUF1064 domain-containing protein [Marinococcus luteus]MDZ5782085.1 DUF1064 domain-containing protein [Marinococcus luteus]
MNKTERISSRQFRTKKKHKYGTKKITVDGRSFDSKLEAGYYQQLLWLKQYGEITDFKLQPRYLLQEAFTKNGKTHRKIEYVADFEVEHKDGNLETVDVKGMETADFKLKRKLFEKMYPQKLSLVTYHAGLGGWCELDDVKKYKKQTKT